MASHRRGPWSPGEDSYLCQLVHTQGALNWVRIAQLIGSRSPKQCRERYHQNLKPTLNHEPISPEEGVQIERMVGEMGKRWAEIARRLHGRSDNAVKNWWNGSMNRRRRLVLRRKTSSPQASHSEQDHSLPFPTPASSCSLSITSPTDRSRCHRAVDHPPLPSPAVSEASRADSLDGAPSLVSDTSSAFSISPRLGNSPGVELPPLNPAAATASSPAYSHTMRRLSVPGLALRPSIRLHDVETQSYTLSRTNNDTKALPSFTPLTPIYHRLEIPCSDYTVPRSPRREDSEPRSQMLTAPPTPAHFPPQVQNRYERREPCVGRDSRMHLSSLLV